MTNNIKNSWFFLKDKSDEPLIQLIGGESRIENVTVIAGTPKKAARILRKRMKGNRIKRTLRQRIQWPSRRAWLAVVALAFLVGKSRG
jgi:hypothetical protein